MPAVPAPASLSGPAAAGRRGRDSLCLPHQQRRQKQFGSEAIAAELLGPFAEFKTATAVNHALGNLFSLVAQGRIAPRNAAVLAYISQLLLNSVGAVRHEAQLARGHNQWERLLRRALRNAPTLSGPAPTGSGRAVLERSADDGPVKVQVVTIDKEEKNVPEAPDSIGGAHPDSLVAPSPSG